MRISLRNPQGVALNRVYGLNKEAVTKYLNNLENLLNEHKFEPHQIYNCDETGITTVHKPAKVVAPTEKNCVSSMTSGVKGITATVLCASNATGHFVPPIMIFKRKNKKASLTDHAPPGTIQGCSENGWVKTELLLEYIKHFVKDVKCSTAKPILIFDGHKSRTKSLECIDYVRENELFLLSLPPLTTHKLQPLDRAVFKLLKAFFNNVCQKWMKNHPGKMIQTENLGELFKDAYIKSATLENAVSSLRTSGIIPFSPNIIPEQEYIKDPRPTADTTTANTSDSSEINTAETAVADCSKSTKETIINDPSVTNLEPNLSNNVSEATSVTAVTGETQVYFDITVKLQFHITIHQKRLTILSKKAMFLFRKY